MPKDAHTLLKTPRSVDVASKCGRDYVYVGIKDVVIRQLTNLSAVHLPENIELYINIDGISLLKYSNVNLWDILGLFEHTNAFLIVACSDSSKPTDNAEFLTRFIEEYQNLCVSGIPFNVQNITIRGKGFLCDAPARQFLKSIKSHNGYNGCERCEVEGQSIERRMIFHDLTAPLRTDAKFCGMDYPEH